MTIDEAINKLNWALDNNTIEDVQSAYEYIEAVELATEALKRWKGAKMPVKKLKAVISGDRLEKSTPQRNRQRNKGKQ